MERYAHKIAQHKRLSAQKREEEIMSKVNERADLDVDIREAEDMVAMYK